MNQFLGLSESAASIGLKALRRDEVFVLEQTRSLRGWRLGFGREIAPYVRIVAVFFSTELTSARNPWGKKYTEKVLIYKISLRILSSLMAFGAACRAGL